eukprot:scaffold26866_cov52-Attheya_sp.AAC.1
MKNTKSALVAVFVTLSFGLDSAEARIGSKSSTGNLLELLDPSFVAAVIEQDWSAPASYSVISEIEIDNESPSLDFILEEDHDGRHLVVVNQCPLLSKSLCSPDSTCECSSEKSLQHTVQANNGNTCYSCVLPDDSDTVCTIDLDCKYGSSECYEGKCTSKDKVPVFCPNDILDGPVRQCTTISGCVCQGDKSEKYSLDLADDGSTCNGIVDCADVSECYEGTCTPKEDVPVACPSNSTGTTRQCIGNGACSCEGDKSERIVLNNRGTSCYACALPDGSTCRRDTDCKPSSQCNDETGTTMMTCAYWNTLKNERPAMPLPDAAQLYLSRLDNAGLDYLFSPFMTVA